MKSKIYKISKKNQITLSSDFLRQVSITEGSFVKVWVDPKIGGIVLKLEKNPIEKWRGISKKNNKISYKEAIKILDDNKFKEDLDV